jgi:CRP/FNR family transcriptional regulator, cyclic AMP receptor protein
MPTPIVHPSTLPDVPIRPAARALLDHLYLAGLATIPPYDLRRTFRKGNVLYEPDDPCTDLLVLLEGSIKLTVPGDDDREWLAKILNAVELFGYLGLIDGQAQGHRCTVLSPTAVVLRFPAGCLRPATTDRLDTDGASAMAIASTLLQLVVTELRDTLEQAADLATMNTRAAIAKHLLVLADGGTTVTVSQGNLAALAGRRRETVNQTLRSFATRGWIRCADGQITLLQPDALRGLLGRTRLCQRPLRDLPPPAA